MNVILHKGRVLNQLNHPSVLKNNREENISVFSTDYVTIHCFPESMFISDEILRARTQDCSHLWFNLRRCRYTDLLSKSRNGKQ